MKILETERLVLRKWSLDDAEDLFYYAKDERVGPNAGWKPHENIETSKRIIEGFIEEDEVYALVHKKDNKVIGGIGLHNRSPLGNEDVPQLEIGYVLNPDYWGRGLIPEATKRVIQYGFDELDLEWIWCAHYDFNMNSKRVIEKCNFHYSFMDHKILEKLDNKEVICHYYRLKKEDYEKNKDFYK